MINQLEALISRKGNAVTGNYYLAKCDICEEMFTSERMTGGEPIADTGDYGDCYCPHCGSDDSEIIDCGSAETVEAWNFQQKCIDALIAALEQSSNALLDAGKRIAELEDEVKFLGVMRCNTCNFSRSHVIVTPGGMTAGESTPERCPNGCGPLWHDTYRRQYNELYDAYKELEVSQ